MDTSSPLFLMYMMDGYSFRNTIGTIKSETDHASMVLSPQSVDISFLNKTSCAVHNISIRTEDIKYMYNIRDEEGNLLKEYPIAFGTNEMFNTMKSIGKRDGLKIYWLAGDSKINIQPIKTSTKDPGRVGALFVKILTKEHVKYDVIPYNTSPNVKIYTRDFAELCSQAITSHCSSLDIISRPNEIVFKGILANKTEACINKFKTQVEVLKTTKVASNLDEIDTLLDNLHITNNNRGNLTLNIIKREDEATISIPLSTVKALSKIHNISPMGTQLKLYFEEKKPIKIESPIGTYGTYSIYLRNKNTHYTAS